MRSDFIKRRGGGGRKIETVENMLKFNNLKQSFSNLRNQKVWIAVQKKKKKKADRRCITDSRRALVLYELMITL